MKKLSFMNIGITAIAVMAMIGCGNSGGDNTASTTSGSTPTSGGNAKKLKIGISIPAADHGWTAGVKYWAEDEAKKHPDVEFDIQTADTPEKQITQLEAMATNQVDGVVILATESAPVTPAVKKLKEQGIFITNVDRGFTEDLADIFVAGDNKKFGRMSAEYMVKKLNGKGNILILEGIPCTVNTDRVEAAKEVFAKSPGIKILDSQSGMWNQDKAFTVTQTLLTKHAQVDAIWAQDDDMALGAEKALKAAGRDKNIWMLGGAGMKDIVKRVMDGDAMFPADITYPPSMIAIGIKEAVTALTGMTPEARKAWKLKNVDVPIDLIEPANAKDFYFPESIF
ncbi:MAG TPA: ABC transporter substrate-binding protein [Fimbriimonas sp.]|nr:ABC transporter substrate-binding protein [Fimbriimonas sp.]